MSNSNKTLIFIGISSLLIGCTSPSDTSPALFPPEGDFAKATCFYKPDEGDSAVIGQLSQLDNERAAFDKEFNRAKLVGVLSASANETIGYVTEDSLNIFKNESDGIGCNMYTQAKQMPSGVRYFWQKSEEAVSKGDPKDSKSEKVRIMGLYVGKTTTILHDSGENNPFIIVRENSTRWTLVHEFMHHLFMTRALEKGHEEATMKRHIQETIQPLSEMKESDIKTVAGLRKAAHLFAEFTKANDEFLVHYPLEEIAVEDHLRREYDAGNLRFVTAYDYNSAGWYIRYSANMFGKKKQASETFISSLKNAISESGMNERDQAEILNDLEMARGMLSRREIQVQEVKARNTHEEYTSAFGVTGIMTMQILERHRPCSHAVDDLAQIEILEKLNQKFHP